MQNKVMKIKKIMKMIPKKTFSASTTHSLKINSQNFSSMNQIFNRKIAQNIQYISVLIMEM